jgi:hypothetical protein
MSDETLREITPRTEGAKFLSNTDILRGPSILPQQRILLYSPQEWEDFIEEWAFTLKLSGKYQTVRKATGAGDKGRDVVGISSASGNQNWDNYQCKHYAEPLSPAAIALEVGKCLYYTFLGDYSVPARFYFIAPREVSPLSSDLLGNADKLRDYVVNNWTTVCEKKITKAKTIKLEGDLEKWVDKFDFSIFDWMPIKEIIEQHSKSKFHSARFGNGLVKHKPKPVVPGELQSEENVYVRKLLECYADRLGKSCGTLDDIKEHADESDHFRRQRYSFFAAETLRVFSRETLPDEMIFQEFQNEIHAAVVDVGIDPTYGNAFDCLQETLKRAQQLPIQDHALASYASPTDKRGVCHQLANDDRLFWKKNDK